MFTRNEECVIGIFEAKDLDSQNIEGVSLSVFGSKVFRTQYIVYDMSQGMEIIDGKKVSRSDIKSYNRIGIAPLAPEFIYDE